MSEDYFANLQALSRAAEKAEVRFLLRNCGLSVTH